MILPTKHLAQDRALLTVGATILQCLTQAMTVSALWELLSCEVLSNGKNRSIGYDSFVLTLDLLFLMGAIELKDGLLWRMKS